MQGLQILAATYGQLDVTDIVQNLVSNNSVSVAASNSIFTDPLPGYTKTLVIVYRYHPSLSVQFTSVQEGQTANITSSAVMVPLQTLPNPNGWNILHATYGLADVTTVVQNLANNQQTFSVPATNTQFGDSWPNVVKSCTIVAQYGASGTPLLFSCKESETIFVEQAYVAPAGVRLNILGAIYGPTDVTKICQNKIKNESLKIDATNAVFTDTWPNVKKTLIVFYRFLGGPVKIAIKEEGEVLTIRYNPDIDAATTTTTTSNDEYKILGAVYGKAEATSIVAQKCESNENAITIPCTNAVFGDSFSGWQKTLVVLSQSGQLPPVMTIGKENENMILTKPLAINMDCTTLFAAGDAIQLFNFLNMPVSENSYNVLHASANDNPSNYAVVAATGGFSLKNQNGDFVCTKENQLVATVNASDAAIFTALLFRDGHIRLRVDNKFVVTSKSSLKLSASKSALHCKSCFSIAMKPAATSTFSVQMANNSWILFIQHMTTGLLKQAIGGYGIKEMPSSVLAFLFMFEQSWATIQQCGHAAAKSRAANEHVAYAIKIFKVLNKDNVLWSVLKQGMDIASMEHARLHKMLTFIAQLSLINDAEADALSNSLGKWSMLVSENSPK